jgi:hypothetical protein
MLKVENMSTACAQGDATFCIKAAFRLCSLGVTSAHMFAIVGVKHVGFQEPSRCARESSDCLLFPVHMSSTGASSRSA